MTNHDFWMSISNIINEGFTSEGLAKLDDLQNNSVLERSYINDFHRQSSLAALKGEQYMLLHPYSREQKLAQINSLRQNTVSKENSNLERSKKNA